MLHMMHEVKYTSLQVVYKNANIFANKSLSQATIPQVNNWSN